jgi:hypothetical protein
MTRAIHTGEGDAAARSAEVHGPIAARAAGGINTPECGIDAPRCYN